MKEINCSVVSDLLPLYTEGMVSEDTRAAIEEHISECAECREKLEAEREELPAAVIEHEEEVKPLKKFRFLMIMNILGSPLWLPLLIAALIVVLAVYIALWAGIAALWCIPLSGAATFLGGAFSAGVAFSQATGGAGLMYIGGALIGAGIAVLGFFGCLTISKYYVRLTEYILNSVTRFINKKKETKTNEQGC